MMPAMTCAVDIIEEEYPCCGCEYDLRGLPADGRCPECGVAVGVSLEGNTLHHADPRWLKRLMVAGWLVPAGVAAAVLLIVGESMPPAMATATGRAVVGAVTAIATEAACYAGLAMMLLPRPNRFLNRPWMRRVGVGAIATALMCGIFIAGVSVVMTWRADAAGGSTYIIHEYTAMSRVMDGVGLVSILLTGIALCVGCFYAAALLRRVPRSSLPWWFSLAGWMIGVSWLIAWLLSLAQRLWWDEPSSPGTFSVMDVRTAAFMAIVAVGYAGVLLGIVLSPIAAVRLGRVRRTAIRVGERAIV